MSSFRPLLASPVEDPAEIKFPVLVSPKLDGVRCVIRGGVPYTRKLKPIANHHIRDALSGLLPNLDGELLLGEHDAGVFERTSAAVRTHEGTPDFTFWVFDMAVDSGEPFHVRLTVAERAAGTWFPLVKPLPHIWVHDFKMLMKHEASFVDRGYEGLMIRDPNGPYKHGRSTAKEGYLLKWKRWLDAEAIVVDCLPLMRNQNEAEVSELGLTKRAKKKEHMRPDLTRMGRLVCRWYDAAKYGPAEFEIGTGFTDFDRQHLNWCGKVVRFKFQSITADGKPRFPVYQAIRDRDDVVTQVEETAA